MTAVTDASTTTTLLAAFRSAEPGALAEPFTALVETLWTDGTLVGPVDALVPLIVAEVETAASDRVGYLLVLLGLLSEAEYPVTDGPVTTAVRAGLPTYLDLFANSTPGQPLNLALLYLLSHLPDDRAAILSVADGLGLTPDDETRLRRCLQPLNRADVVLGRVWPSPHEWSLSDSQRDFDRGWIANLSDEQLTSTWRSDTRSVFAYTGAKAFWAVQHGTPTVVTDTGTHADPQPGQPVDTGIDVFARHASAFACPVCHTSLDFTDAGGHCATCSVDYPLSHGVLDLSGGSVDHGADDGDVLQNAAAMQGIGYYYEAVLRPAFLRVMGSNWDGAITPTGEDAYLTEHTAPTDGPLLDLAAGAGRWTAVLADKLGAERVVALDVITPMLVGLRGRLPELATIRGDALSLPFADASLGGVNCWNALQALPDAAHAIAEIGRCLRPGGVLTMLTFRWGSDRIYRYFQHAHAFPGSPDGIELFELEQITDWLAAAGLAVRTVGGPGTFVFITAQRSE